MLHEVQSLPKRLAFATQDGTCLNASPKEWERRAGISMQMNHLDKSQIQNEDLFLFKASHGSSSTQVTCILGTERDETQSYICNCRSVFLRQWYDLGV